ncbi:MAG TPA: transketolase C-terminal domain-containing protein, partial [Streptosporangiaceae bacterium]
GVTGPDGASHHGMWDGSILQIVPGMKVAVPRDGTRLVELLRECVAVSDGPTALRFPGKSTQADIASIGNVGTMDILAEPADRLNADVLLVAAGPMAAAAVEVADRLAGQGIGVTVVDPRWVKPLDEALLGAAAKHRLVATIEDNGMVGGFGDAVARLLREAESRVPVRTFGLPQSFLAHGERTEILHDAGLSPQNLALLITAAVARLDSDLVPGHQS